MEKEKKEIVITFKCDVMTPEKFVELKLEVENLLENVFNYEDGEPFTITVDEDENFNTDLLDAYINSLEEVGEECDDHECEFNFCGQCMKDDNEEPEELIQQTDNEDCQCPFCQNEKLEQELADLTGDYMELHKILEEKDEEIKGLTNNIHELNINVMKKNRAIENLTNQLASADYLITKLRK